VFSTNNDRSGTDTTRPETTRRNFLNRLWAGLGFLAMVELIAVGAAFLRRGKAGPAAAGDSSLINCGSVNNYTPGSVTAFVRGRFYLARLKNGGFLAISRQCTHLGCTVPWQEGEQRFTCPCHASVFDITGNVINAPAPRPLDLYPLRIENDEISVDTRRAVRRGDFNPKQVVYPAAS
jgi:cytochrome b6-f complex iron-sulfur subunit